MDERKIKILQAIIDDYISTGEPVGSRTIAKKYDLGVSSATIRNEMADLEEMGYLEQLHTSSGRKPSDKGYRLYVDSLMELEALSPEEELTIKSKILENAIFEVDKIIKEASILLSDLTKLTSIVNPPSAKGSRIKAVQLLEIDGVNILLVIVTETGVLKNTVIKNSRIIDEEALYRLNIIINRRLRNLTIDDINLEVVNNLKNDLEGFEEVFNGIIPALYETLKNIDTIDIITDGATNMFNYPEYNDIKKAKGFFDLINNQSKLKGLIDSPSGRNVSIGGENFIQGAEECSVISAVYSVGDKPLRTIGVIGPTRMHYGKVIAIMNTIVKELNNCLSKGYLEDK